MNKIYKVIWSKAKHTYVVASEIAKGHTKGETTGKGLKKLAAAMLVAAALLSPSFAWAADTTVKVEPAATSSATAVEVYTKEETEKEISTLSTQIGNNATNINTNTTNINGLNTRVTALETADKNSVTKVTGSDATLTITKGDGTTSEVTIDNVNHATSADSATKATQDGDGNEISATYATKTELSNEVSTLQDADSKLSSRTSALEDKTGSLTRVAAAHSTSINESMTLKGNQYSATLQVNGSGAQIGVVNNSDAGLANDGGTAYTEYRARTGMIVSKATNDISSTSSNGQVIDTAGDTAGEYSKVATAKSTGTTFTYSDGTTSSSTTIKGDSVSTGSVSATSVSATAGITDGTTTDGTSVKASQTVGKNLNALDERITNVKEYVLSETVSKTDAAVQDGAIVKAANTIGDNVTKLDAALAKETAARIGADATQDKVIQQVNDNLVASVNTINKTMGDGFKALSQVDANELAGRVAADTQLAKAVNNGLSLGDGNVLQKNTTSVATDGTVTTSKTDATEMILNKDKDNQITLNDKGIKVGTNSSVMDANGVYTGGDTYAAAKAAMSADGSIKGADGKFTVDGTNGNVNTKGSVTAASGMIGNVSMSADGTVTGVKDLTASGKVTADSFTDGTATMSNGSLNGVNQINATGNIVTTGNMKAHDITAEGTIKGETINGTTGTFGSLTTTGNASVGGTLTTNGITNTGNTTTDSLTVKQGATVGGNLGVTGDITGKSLNVGAGAIIGGQITGTGLDVGAGTIKTTGAVETGTLKTTGKAEIGGDLTVTGNTEMKGNLGVKGDLSVEGEFNAKTLSSKLDENNYTTINGGKTESMNLKMDKKTGEFQASGSTFDETGSNAWANDHDSIGKSSMTADKISQSLSETGDNLEKAASRVLSQNKGNKYEITDSVVEGNQSNVENRTADTTDSQISFKDDSGKVLNKSYITQNLKKVLMGVEEGDNKTTIEQDANNITNTAKNGTITNDAGKLVNTASDTIANMAGNDITNTSTNGNIANTAANGTISNNAKNLTNTASENITNKAENGNISNIASNGTISNEAKTISNKADEALTNDAKTITNTASESVTTQIGDGSEVQSVMNGGGIANKATGKSITNDAATITNTGTTSVTNQVGNNKVLVDTTHVQSAFGDTIYTTWDERGITNNATDKTVATNAKNIQNTATGDITNTASNGTITNDAKTLLNKASESITDKVGDNIERTMTTKKISESVKDGTKSNTFTKTYDKDINVVTDGTNTSTESQLADSVNTSLKNGTQSLNNTKTVTEDVTKVTDKNTGAFSSSSQKADAMTNTVKNGSKSNTVTETASTSEQKLVSGNIIDILKDAETGYVNTTVSNSDGSSSTGVKQTYTDITSTAKQGTITNDAKNLVNKAEEKLSNSAAEIENTATTSIKDTVGKSTVTTTTDGTTFENTDHNVAIDDGSITKTTISGNTLETGKATMDYAEVMKDLRVGGTTTTKDLHVTNNATIDGTLGVTGAAKFQNTVTVVKDLSVGGNATVAGDVTADSYKVGDKTYIDKDGINANNQVIRNVGQGNISEGSTDAVSGGQLYETNTRVSGLETRMGTVETRVDKLDGKIDKVGANAAAMANLHPLEFDEDSKWNIAAAVGSSGSETASAVGVFYRPNENVMVNASAAMGTGENMFGGGVSLRLGHGGNKAKEAQMKAAAAENKELRAKVDDLTARMDALLSVLNPNMSKDFPDVPENHWAYEAVSRLAGNGIVEGYEDGKYHGERQMTRYEMAEIIYNALSKGAKAEKKLVEEFRPELQAMAAQKKA